MEEYTKSDIYEMELHEEIRLDNCMAAVRVPGGWLYSQYIQANDDGWCVSTTFVPFDNEFQGNKP